MSDPRDRAVIQDLTRAVDMVGKALVHRNEMDKNKLALRQGWAKEAAIKCLMFSAGTDRQEVEENFCWRELEEIILLEAGREA